MDKKNLIPQVAKPVVRVTQGTQTNLLAELSEEVLSGTMGLTSLGFHSLEQMGICSMDDDGE
ncbi:MAG: microcyclamide/patellamide family RiPP [Symploca sp. SIO2G7]|nr:microcyclamide/patellamide family RiPP [Symploca sp. SIO2G7]